VLSVCLVRISTQFVESVSDEIGTPPFDRSRKVDLVGVGPEIRDRLCFVDVPFIGSELPENRSDLVVVRELVPVEKVERDRRVESGALVGVDERVIRDEQSEGVKRLPVDSRRSCSERSGFDILERKLDIATISDTDLRLVVLRHDVVVDGENVLD